MFDIRSCYVMTVSLDLIIIKVALGNVPSLGLLSWKTKKLYETVPHLTYKE